ncbi:hypothetical protein ACHAXS_006769, partial [Conticribra weissflogii]
HLHWVSTGSFVSSEVKIAILLRFLASGSYIDIAVLCGISTGHIHTIFHIVVDKLKIDGVSYHMDDNKMEKVSRGFCKGINGVFAGCIGALDGWLVKIEKPSLIRDGVQNPSLYFSRKGFYGVNVQIIVSHNKTFCIVEQNMIQLHLKMGLLENG